MKTKVKRKSSQSSDIVPFSVAPWTEEDEAELGRFRAKVGARDGRRLEAAIRASVQAIGLAFLRSDGAVFLVPYPGGVPHQAFAPLRLVVT